MSPDFLSQEEIDAMLARGFSGEGDDESAQPDEPVKIEEMSAAAKRRARNLELAKKAKPHDFINPKIFSKENLRAIKSIYENFAKHLSSYMTGTLHANCTLTMLPPEELKYSEYNNALPDTVMMGVIEAQPIEGNMLIEFSRPTAYTIIDRLLGGSGDDIVVQEDFSEVEERLMERFYRQIMEFLKESWGNVTEIKPVFKRIATNSRLTQLMPLEDTVIIITMSVQIKDQVGSMSICVPGENLENILSNASNYMLFNRKRKDTNREENQKALLSHLKESKLDVRCILGTTTIKLQDLLYLQVGDYIELDKSIESPLNIRVGPYDRYCGEIGKKKNKVAVKVKSVL